MSINTLKYIEKYIKIKDKDSNIVSFILNKPQKRLYDLIKEQHLKGVPIRIIILKARQMGFSTLTEAIIFKNTVTNKNINSGIITHQDTATTNLFNMSKLMYNNLPVEIQPSIKNSNAKELIFDKEGGSGLNSKIKCMTAGSKGVGRSDTINNLHISELAFWEGDKKQILTGLLQAVPNKPNSMIIIESTANGFDYYQELWEKAVNGESNYIPLFVGWNELEEYQMPYSGFELTTEEKELKKIYNLSNNQLEWRRNVIKDNFGGDIELFKQEYPICPQEAFISTGTCVFNKQDIINRIQALESPVKTGYFKYETYYDKEKNEVLIDNDSIEFVEDKKGYIKIYKDKIDGYPYVIGGDTSGEGSDFFTGQVLNNTNGEQVAVLKHLFDEDIYAKQMYCLATYFNTALLAIETNYSTYPNKELTRLEYPNLYIREKEDTYSNNIIKSYGFVTNKKTRPVIIAGLVEFTRENIDMINDKETLEEMLKFVRNQEGRAEAQQGAHDDLVMAKAIAHYIRPQQSYLVVKKEIKKEIPFELQEAEIEENEYAW